MNISIGVLAFAGSMAMAGAFVTGTFFTSATFIVLALFAVVCSPLSLSLGKRVRLSSLQVFVLAAVLLAGTSAAVAVAALGSLSVLLVGRPRPQLHQAVAMFTGYPLEALVAGWMFTLTGGVPGEFATGANLVALLFATSSYYLSHTLIAATLAGLEERAALPVVWLERYAWMLPSFLGAGAAAAVVGLVHRWVGLHALVLLVPFVVLLFQHYRLRAERDRLRAELERLHAQAPGGAGRAGSEVPRSGSSTPSPYEPISAS